MLGLRTTPRFLRAPRLDGLDRDDLRAYFRETWDLYEWLFSSLTSEASFQQQPEPLRHPLIFYYGHTAAFYVNKLHMAGLVTTRLDPPLERLLAQGVDPKHGERLDGPARWPTFETVVDFRRRVHALVEDVIETAKIPDIVTWDEPLWSLLMAMEHDRIHLETSSVLLRQAPVDDVRRPDGWTYAPTFGGTPNTEMLFVPSAEGELGKPSHVPTFGWDNEYGKRPFRTKSFLASRNLVTNAEMLDFVQDGGYRHESLWSPVGWTWRTAESVKHPRFWVPDGSGFRYRAMFDEMDLPLDWPAEVNAHEARAFCRWKGRGVRLPTESEHTVLSSGRPLVEGETMWSDAYNLNLRFGSPTPVGAMRRARSPAGFNDVAGNVWQWLRDDFTPLPGFRTHPLYEDFSAPFFTSQHAVLLGGSFASTGTSASRYYRLWFRRNFFQHAGFRLARDTE